MKYSKIYVAKICRIAVGVSFAVLVPLDALAQAVIQSVMGSVQNGADVVRIEFAEPLQVLPTGFSIQSPPRIALDFSAASNATGKSVFELNQGNVKSVNVVQAGDRSRVVLNLKSPTSYQADIQGKSLLITLGTASQNIAQPAQAQVFADAANTDVLTLKDVDFRRGADGSGRVVVTLPSSQVGVDIRQQGKGLVVDFLKSALPEGLRRRLDVGDFGTPVQAITTVQQGERVRMTIDPVGEWEHSAYQSDSQFVIEVRQKKVDLNKLTQGPGYSGEKLSLNFQNIEVRSLLQVIADFTNFNIVTSDTVTGSLTLRLKDVPWDQALQIIMEAKGLGMRKSGTVLWIAPKDEIDDRTKKDYEAALAIQKLEPLRTQAFQMNYAKAVDMITQLTTSSGGSGGGTSNRFLSERGSAIAEPRTNQLFVTDTASKLEEVRQLLATLDVAVRQVMIEARIVEASDTFGRSLGVRLGATDLRANRGGTGGYNIGGGNSVAFGTSYSNAVASSGAGGAANTLGNFVNLPAQAQGGFDPASFAISIFNSAANRFLNLEISAMEADGKGKIVSSPRVVTADQTKASIEQGTEFPYPVTAPNGGTVIAFKKAVLKLEVLPQITPEGNIILDLDVNKDSPGEILQNVRAINTKHIKTQVLVENGGTVVIGGIFELFEDDAEAKVPFLGDIPGVGNLFKTKTKQANKQEMLIFITPKVITERTAVR